MSLQRQVRTISLGESRVKHRVVVQDDPCPKGTVESRVRYLAFLQTLAESQHLLICGHEIPDRVVIEHNGVGWCATAEAEAGT